MKNIKENDNKVKYLYRKTTVCSPIRTESDKRLLLWKTRTKSTSFSHSTKSQSRDHTQDHTQVQVEKFRKNTSDFTKI